MAAGTWGVTERVGLDNGVEVSRSSDKARKMRLKDGKTDRKTL